MTDAGYNKYDRPRVDVDALYRDTSPPFTPYTNPFRAIYGTRLLPLTARRVVWQLLTQTHVDLFWFFDFRRYWSKALKLRPLWGVEDFYFLRAYYRISFGRIEVADSTEAEAHMAAWKSSELLYFLMQQVYVESKTREFEMLRLTRRYLGRGTGRYLEFGSGIGPITQTFLDFEPGARASRFYVSDIRTVAFHYATERFRSRPNVTCVPLEEANELHLPADFPGDLDAIYCITVFEHLHAPMITIQRLHGLLKPGGLFFFDYIQSEGTGLDSAAGVRERAAVLQFVREHFDVVVGAIDPAGSVPLTVVRKKQPGG